MSPFSRNWGKAPAEQAARTSRSNDRIRTWREDLLQLDVVIPVIAEVVGIAQPVPRLDDHVGQREPVLVLAVQV
jgi:hypothetical protein